VIYDDYIYVQGEPGEMKNCGTIYEKYDDINMTFTVAENLDKTGYVFSYYKHLDKIQYGHQFRAKLLCNETDEEELCTQNFTGLASLPDNATVTFSLTLFLREVFMYRFSFHPTIVQTDYKGVELRFYDDQMCVDFISSLTGVLTVQLDIGDFDLTFDTNV